MMSHWCPTQVGAIQLLPPRLHQIQPGRIFRQQLHLDLPPRRQGESTLPVDVDAGVVLREDPTVGRTLLGYTFNQPDIASAVLMLSREDQVCPGGRLEGAVDSSLTVAQRR